MDDQNSSTISVAPAVDQPLAQTAQDISLDGQSQLAQSNQSLQVPAAQPIQPTAPELTAPVAAPTQAPAAADAATAPAAAPAPADDPLARLMGLVQGGDGASSLAGLNVKELFVVTRSKLSNKSLRKIVEIYQEKGKEQEEILDIILDLDQAVEKGELSQELFEQLEAENGW